MLNLNTVMLYSENPKELAEFYKKVFQKDPEWEDESYHGFGVGDASLMIGLHDKVHGKSQNPERVILNFEVPDVEREFERIKGLGATVIAEPYHPGEVESMSIATLADPDGNYFQLVTPMDPNWEKN